MALAGPAKLLGETDSISSGSDREGGKIATGLEFNRAAHLLATFVNDNIVKGDVPGIIDCPSRNQVGVCATGEIRQNVTLAAFWCVFLTKIKVDPESL